MSGMKTGSCRRKHLSVRLFVLYFTAVFIVESINCLGGSRSCERNQLGLLFCFMALWLV